MKHKNLLSPITINGMTLKNRFCMPAISLVYCPDGEINEKITQFYVTRARGGVGLVTVGGCAIDHVGHSFAMVKLSEDKYIDGLKRFTDEIHFAGAKVGAQLFQNGRYARAAVTGNTVLGPSPVFAKYSNEMPREMTVEEIKETVQNFASAAKRAKTAGFDMVEILASAGYLLCQFLSPVTNLRTDEYGGSWENRCRFPREVVKAIRAAVGSNYPIFVRLTGNDFVKGSNTNEEAV